MTLQELLGRCLEQGVELEVRDGALEVFYDEEPEEELFALLKQHKEALLRHLAQAPLPGAPELLRRERNTGGLPLSFSQQRLWFVDQAEGGSAQYNLFRALAFEGSFELELAQQAFARVIERHEPLRTVFATRDGEPVQLVQEDWRFELPCEDLALLPAAEGEARIAAACEEEALHNFDLAAGLMLRARVLRRSAASGVLLVNVHHIAADGWSLALLIDEFIAHYQALDEGRDAVLAPLPVRFADFAAWQREYLSGERLERQLAYWQKQLAGLPPVHGLALDRPRPARQDFRGALHTERLQPSTAAGVARLAAQQGVTPFMLLHAVFSALLARYARQEDVVLGTPVANRQRSELEGLVGYFANTLVLRTCAAGELPFSAYLQQVRDANLGAQEHQDVPFELLVERLNPARSTAHSPLFQIFFSMNTAPAASRSLQGLSMRPLQVAAAAAKFDLALNVAEADGTLELRFEYSSALFEPATIAQMSRHFATLLDNVLANPECTLASLDLMDDAERAEVLARLQGPALEVPSGATIHGLFAQRAAQQPDAIALEAGDERYTYAELEARANALAELLREHGAAPGQLVGVCIERSAQMVIGLLAVLKAGAAYLPLDPAYPAARLAYMVEDSQVALLLTQTSLLGRWGAGKVQALCVDAPEVRQAMAAGGPAVPDGDAAQLAYMIYTSGSTGKPKGVMIEHRNVVNFLHGVQGLLGGPQAVWLGLTAISFDISVLEIFGSLLSGARLVVAPEQGMRAAAPGKPLGFSLFYFASSAEGQQDDIYRLLLEGARFADQNGFTAVWTPERHFASFGGMYPNPGVTGAAVAAITSRVQVRAGSCVLPLNDPLKVAEDWSVIDNLSQGRVGLAFASGWNPNDFALQPDHFARRHEVLFEGVETFRAFWSGQGVRRRNGVGQEIEVKLFPAPKQAMPPIWITAAGSEHTFRRAGQMGANVLTHLLGQTVGELAEKIAVYRQAWREAGHEGEGKVTLMVHTFLAATDEEALAAVHGPFKTYLGTSLALLNAIRDEAATGGPGPDAEAILEMAFQRYARSAALFGSAERCAALVSQLQSLGVSEIACLIDFGVETQRVLDSLPLLAALKDRFQDGPAAPATASVGELVRRHGVTHLQCTPSMAAMLLAEPEQRASLAGLRAMLVGGEALPAALAGELLRAGPAALYNMYGPTEATVWATCQRVSPEMAEVPLGAALPNYGMCVAGPDGMPVPLGVPGELLITGPGLACGYWQRPELTAERFVALPGEGSVRAYRTGDLVRQAPGGALQFLGRIDDQVKLRGFRIELGEIESQLLQHTAVQAAAAVVREDVPGMQQLLAYVAPAAGYAGTAAQLGRELRGMLALVLPDYMVPAAVTVLPALPLTPNGKLDRRALPAPQLESAAAAYVAPRSEAEKLMADIWGGLLKVAPDKVSAHANFFDLGGHSLLLMRLAGEIGQRFGAEMSIREAFELPTLAQMAALAEQKRAAPADRERFARLQAPIADSVQEVVI